MPRRRRSPAARAPLAALAAAAALVAGPASRPGLGAQRPGARAAGEAWNDSATLALVRRADALRRAQFADTALRGYRATARGTIAFLGQLGDLVVGPPRVVQATQVATEVYWRAPNTVRQVVVGARDTTVLPTDNQFYRDRYGVVVNNFPDVIRLGEGRDVADVPHPLSPAGLAAYDFAARDTVGIRLGGGQTLRLAEVRVRPRDPSAPRIVGSLFFDLATARLARLAFTFTRAAYLDPRNEDVSVVLENGLVEGRFWLPRRQEVEVRRAGTFLDFPARGIIRGRWEIGEYVVDAPTPDSVLAGPPLAFAPPEALRRYPFGGRVVDALPPDIQLATQGDVARVRAQAQALVQQRALTRARTASVAARSASDFARVTRAEGLALGGGVALRPSPAARLGLAGRYGLADRQAKGRLSLAWARPSGAGLRAELAREYAEAGDAAETSRLRNSVAAQEFGSDWTDPFDARVALVAAEGPPAAAEALGGLLGGARLAAALSAEAHRPVAVRARPFAGRYAPTLAADPLRLVRLALALERPAGEGPFGTTLAYGLRAAGAATTLGGCARPAGAGAPGFGDLCSGFGRVALTARATRPAGDRRLVLETVAAGAAGTVPVQELALLGGPVTGPGYAFHALAGRAGLSQRVEWQFPVPAPSVSLGRYGRSPATATLAPYAHLAAVGRVPALVRPGAAPARAGLYPAVGVGALTFFDLLRVDVARGVGRGGRWLLSVDAARDFWRVL
jgi:hypothetical protein